MRFERIPLYLRCAMLAQLLLPLAAIAEADRRGDVLENAAQILQARYTDEAKANQLAQMLRTAKRDGRFAGIAEPRDYADALTQALRETVPDLHLKMSYEPDNEFDPSASSMQMVQRRDDSGATRQVMRSGRIDGRSDDQIARTNYGITKVEQLEGNIGYLKLNQFIPAELSRETLRAAVTLIANSDAVIIDLRENRGGSPDAVGELLSPFFPAEQGPVELHASENRAMGERRSLNSDPSLSRPKLATAPLYVLIGESTASAAEMYAYAARRLGRATLVGATTRGAGQGAMKHSVGNGFALLLSEWRMLTGPGWEGVGVTPDIQVGSAEALDRAIALAREAITNKG